jgi:hypothetical protein
LANASQSDDVMSLQRSFNGMRPVVHTLDRTGTKMSTLR